MVCIFEQYRLPAARTRTIITVVRWHFLKCFRKSPSSFSMSFFLNLHNLSLAMRFFLREGNARQTAALIDHLSLSIFADHPSPPSFSTSPPLNLSILFLLNYTVCEQQTTATVDCKNLLQINDESGKGFRQTGFFHEPVCIRSTFFFFSYCFQDSSYNRYD